MKVFAFSLKIVLIDSAELLMIKVKPVAELLVIKTKAADEYHTFPAAMALRACHCQLTF